MNATFGQFFAQLISFVLVIMVMSYGIGLIVGGGKTDKANKIVAWEFKQLTSIVRWILMHIFKILADIFHGLAVSCSQKKKKQKP